MEFKRIQANQFSFNQSTSNDVENLPSKKNKEDKINCKKSPVNPKFWQLQKNISFRGKEKIDVEQLSISLAQKFKLQDETSKKVSEMLQSGIINPETLKRIDDNNYFIHDIDIECFKKVIDEIYDDNSKSKLLSNLVNPKISLHLFNLPYISHLISNKDDFPFEFTNYLLDNFRGEDEFIFNSEDEIARALRAIDKDNFEDFKKFDETYSKTTRETISKYYRYQNPVTNKFDGSLFNFAETLRKSDSEFYSDPTITPYNDRASEVVLTCVNNEGTLDNKAVEFIHKYSLFDTPSIDKRTATLRRLKRKLNPIAKAKHLDSYYFENAYDFKTKLPQIIQMLKNKDGEFDDTNIKYMSKMIEKPDYSYYYDISFFDAFKDKNGVVQDDKFKVGMKVLEEINGTTKMADYISGWEKLGNRKYTSLVSKLKKLTEFDTDVYDSFPSIAKYCFDEKGNEIKGKLDLVKKVYSSINDFAFEDSTFEVLSSKENEELFLSLIQKENFNAYMAEKFLAFANEYKLDDGTIHPFAKKVFLESVNSSVPPHFVVEVFKQCVKDEKNPELNFDFENYNRVTKILKEVPALFNQVGAKNLIAFINGEFSVQDLEFKQKIHLFQGLNKIVQTKNFSNDSKFEFIQKAICDLDKSLSVSNISLPVSKEARQLFMSTVVGIKKVNSDGYSDFEVTMKDSIDYLKTFDEGIPLSYSREEFLVDLNLLFNSKEEATKAANKFGINLTIDENNGFTINGYEGIINFDNADNLSDKELQMLELCKKFMYENSVQTEDEKLNNELNKIIKAIPEFINIIGKKQHGTHKYTLDIHSLLVMASSIDNPDYLKLNNLDKVMLKTACIFHDIAKHESVVDNGHQNPSAIYARSIVQKFFPNEELRDRIFELIKNHHWLAEYNTSSDKEKNAKQYAYKFRRPNDFEIAKIMARSDLMSVSEEFYRGHKDALNQDRLKPIEDKLTEFYASGCAIFIDNFIKKSDNKDLRVKFKDREYTVVNFHNIKPDESVAKYGFNLNRTKKDLRFLVHMVHDNKIKDNLQALKLLTSSVNGGVLSESIITPDNTRTYCNRKYGVLLSQINANTINVNKHNQGSGAQKSFDNAIGLVFDFRSETRKNYKKNLLKKLHINPDVISNEEYAKFYKEHLIGKVSLAQIPDSKIYPIGDYDVSGADLKKALQEVQDDLINTEEDDTHNEIVGYAPKINAVVAKEKELKDVPKDLLDFAYENKLPILLI